MSDLSLDNVVISVFSADLQPQLVFCSLFLDACFFGTSITTECVDTFSLTT